ncbi:MAG: DUF3782 domain-containing protein, partial [SAR324 cluster bacterium]|nr:DUF3782 domain-containing protein [SAR324 cluster bacterium]
MTDQELKDLVASLAQDHKALREAQQATDRQMKETDRRLTELSKNIGGLNNKFGSFTEGMALPSMSKVLTNRFQMNVIAPNVKVRKGG